MPLKDLLKAREFLFELNAPSAGLCYTCWAHIRDIFMLLSILTISRNTGFTSAIQSIPDGTWKILITDEHSQALLDTVYKQFDILQQHVTCKRPYYFGASTWKLY